MCIKTALLALFLLVAAIPARADDKVFGAESAALDNGMQVVVVPNHRAPVATVMVWYRVGSINEGTGQSGLAHFMEHLMFKGTAKVGPGLYSRQIKALGGDENAFTSYDYTAYHSTIATKNLPKILELEADRMTGLTFPADQVTSELKVVLEERRQRTENDPRGYFYEQLRALLFVNHPYGRPVLGWMHEVDSLKRDNAMAFYRQWYAPNNAILVVSGDVTMKELKPLAQQYFGKLKPIKLPARQWTTVPPLTGLPRLTLHTAEIRQPVLERLYRVPSYTQDKTESLALEVMENIMDGGAATRLYRTLVVEKKLASSVGMSYDATGLSDTTVTITAVPAEGVSLETLEKAIDETLRDFIKTGPTAQELREAKDRLKDAAVFARDSLMGPAMIFGQALASGETVADVETWPSQIEGVTDLQVVAAAKKYLNPDDYGLRPYVTGYLLPAEEKQ